MELRLVLCQFSQRTLVLHVSVASKLIRAWHGFRYHKGTLGKPAKILAGKYTCTHTFLVLKYLCGWRWPFEPQKTSNSTGTFEKTILFGKFLKGTHKLTGLFRLEWPPAYVWAFRCWEPVGTDDITLETCQNFLETQKLQNVLKQCHILS